jgi:hypothetical protein
MWVYALVFMLAVATGAMFVGQETGFTSEQRSQARADAIAQSMYRHQQAAIRYAYAHPGYAGTIAYEHLGMPATDRSVGDWHSMITTDDVVLTWSGTELQVAPRRIFDRLLDISLGNAKVAVVVDGQLRSMNFGTTIEPPAPMPEGAIVYATQMTP